MQGCDIVEIGIAEDGSLFVKPSLQTFPFVYRAAMQVGWDEAKARLFSPVPTDWTYGRWFQQIINAVADEYRVMLQITPHTCWIAIPDDVRGEIEAAAIV